MAAVVFDSFDTCSGVGSGDEFGDSGEIWVYLGNLGCCSLGLFSAAGSPSVEGLVIDIRCSGFGLEIEHDFCSGDDSGDDFVDSGEIWVYLGNSGCCFLELFSTAGFPSVVEGLGIVDIRCSAFRLEIERDFCSSNVLG